MQVLIRPRYKEHARSAGVAVNVPYKVSTIRNDTVVIQDQRGHEFTIKTRYVEVIRNNRRHMRAVSPFFLTCLAFFTAIALERDAYLLSAFFGAATAVQYFVVRTFIFSRGDD